MSHRHSDSKRRHSRFDPQPSPKRHRRENGDHRQRLHNKDPTTQHDERGSAGQVGRSSGQKKAEHGWWKESKNQDNERTETSHGRDREQRDEKLQAKLDDNTFQRRDGFSERKNDPPPPISRKRPAFREKKIPMDSGDANLTSAVAAKPSQITHPPERNERKEERSSNPHHLERPEKQFGDDRAPNKGEARRDGFPSRGRYGGNGNYRGRDMFNGRQDYRASKTQTEKWKHDLYQEVNKDPISQNEDDQIAKLEALLAS